jgi:hypothetical protein
MYSKRENSEMSFKEWELLHIYYQTRIKQDKLEHTDKSFETVKENI